MGILARLGFARDTLTADTSVVLPSWSGSRDVSQVASLPQEVAQAFGINTDFDRVTYDQAMSIPAVRQGRNTIAGKIGSTPLVCIRVRAGKAPERVERAFFKQPDSNCPLATTLTDTVDDLIFWGVSYWFVANRDAQGYPSQAARIHPSRVAMDYHAGVVRIDGQVVDWRNIIAFRGPDRGLLYHGARTLKTALMLEEAVRRYARMDVPLGLIEDEQGAMLEDEIQEFLNSWEVARSTRTTGYLPNGLKYTNPGFNPQQIELGDARGFQAAEIARMLNLPASAINAPTNDSLTYSTTVENARELVDLTFAPFRAAIEGRLSMPDVTPLGTSVYLDFSEWLRGDMKTVVETGAAAVNAGLMTVDEVREWMRLGPMPTPEQGAPNGA